jgi:hypothetical protein
MPAEHSNNDVQWARVLRLYVYGHLVLVAISGLAASLDACQLFNSVLYRSSLPVTIFASFLLPAFFIFDLGLLIGTPIGAPRPLTRRASLQAGLADLPICIAHCLAVAPLIQ